MTNIMDDKYINDRINYQLFMRNKQGEQNLSSFKICEELLKEKKVGLINPYNILQWILITKKTKYLNQFLNDIFSEKYKEIQNIHGFEEIINILEFLLLKAKMKQLTNCLKLIKKNNNISDFAEIIVLVKEKLNFRVEKEIALFWVEFIVDFYLDKELYKNIKKIDMNFFNSIDPAKFCLVNINFE